MLFILEPLWSCILEPLWSFILEPLWSFILEPLWSFILEPLWSFILEPLWSFILELLWSFNLYSLYMINPSWSCILYPLSLNDPPWSCILCTFSLNDPPWSWSSILFPWMILPDLNPLSYILEQSWFLSLFIQTLAFTLVLLYIATSSLHHTWFNVHLFIICRQSINLNPLSFIHYF